MREKHRLTDQERRVIMAVAALALIVVTLWLLAIILMLPNPSQGI